MIRRARTAWVAEPTPAQAKAPVSTSWSQSRAGGRCCMLPGQRTRCEPRLPLFTEVLLIVLQIMFKEVIMLVVAADLKIVSAGPFGFGFDLVPAVDDLGDFDNLIIPGKPTRGLIGFKTRMTFDLDQDEVHG